MATKSFIELQEFSDEQLANELGETITQYRKIRFDHALKGLENPLAIRSVRRDIARMKNEVRRREIASMTPEQLAKRTKIRNRK